ncbi:nucleotidyltransferase [Zymobacter palmae]|uniref:Nucleotidyltransferase n=1 Tax=Zymobacter palmae TaxID=33074 RepID=A0A348HE79_9GAMM|nr:nucleotidyltransferase [Zymobacter palmae]
MAGYLSKDDFFAWVSLCTLNAIIRELDAGISMTCQIAERIHPIVLFMPRRFG